MITAVNEVGGAMEVMKDWDSCGDWMREAGDLG